LQGTVGANENAPRFRVTDLALPLQTADDELYAILKGCCEQALRVKSRNVPSLIVDVEREISSRLTRGEAKLVPMAQALGMSPRTLSRRLAKEDTTFFKSLERLRKSLARNYLRDSDLRLAEISFLLGYTSLSSFNEAFKKWTGQTPGQFRGA
jgi:AraC-like DNA-binding protein